ncbi:MAG: eukaryotic-like serine/threonine-protein kinase [Solirubrobacterales bacterium]|jgi:class 3 adenylate cyclase|nr:eukaryotic-like serine/threonine-protein kinase [Solirubrobacterales bacterium]
MRCSECGNLNRPDARFCDSCGARLESPAEAPAPAPGPPADAPELIAGRYRVESFLGRGGRKRVYRALDTQSEDREVAVAVFDTEGIEETALARARREAQAMSKLGESPYIVRVLDSGEEGRVPFIVSEYVGGGDLAGVLDDCQGRRLEIDRAIAIAIDVCRALEHAHARGIIHRDLKPANIWLGDDDSARLGDFGLATTDRRSRAAVEGMLVGTVAYLPPEQALGRSSDERSDLYSLGAMLYELLTGDPPFPGEDAVAIIGQHLNAQPVAPSRHRPEVTPALDRVVLQLLAKSPDERPQSAAEARRAIEAAAAAPAEEPASEVADNPLEALAGGVFVGRDAELDQMRGSLEDALEGQGRLLLLSGDPGIGKTRTAEQLATYAGVRGARVYWGRCQESEGQPPYWPWSEALRSYVLDADPVGLRWQLGSRAADVAQIVPELADRLGDLGEPPDMETEQARFRLFDSFAGFLAGASSDRPMVIVLDDLHWADEPSLLLLRFVARRLADTGLLLIGTYRDVELGRHHPLADTLGDLAGVEGARRVTLKGLDATGIADYIELTAGVDRPPPDLTEAIRDQTGGNPFFIGEVVRLMAAEGQLGEEGARRQVSIPQGVREVVGRRLDRLSDDANAVLRIAAVYGRDFRLDVLGRVCELSAAEIEAALREAVGDRLVNEPAAGLFSFSHALVRETLQAEVAASKRVAMHLEIADALEQVYAGELDRHLGELAHHFIEAAPLGQVDRAVDYATRAAATASRRLAYEDAAVLYEKALEALELERKPDLDRRLGLLLDLGTAQTRASRVGDARATLDRAARLARELGRTDQMAQAVLGMTLLSVAGVVDDRLIELLNESLEAVGEQDSPLRSQLISGLAQELYWTDPAGRSDDLGLQALEMARRLGDSQSLAFALIRRQFTGAVGLEETRRRLRESNEMHDLGKRLGDRELELRAHVYRLRNRLELGEMHEVDADLAAFERLANELRQPTHLWHVPGLKAMRALIDGRFDDAERLIAEALEAGTRAEEPVSAQFQGTQIALLRRLRRSEADVAELGNLVAGLADLADRFPAIPAWRCSLAATHAELGHENETRAVFETLAADDFADLPLDAQWAISLCLLAEAAVFLDDVPRARLLYEHLLPYDGLNVIAGRAAASYGPVARILGLLAVTDGRLDDAERHFTDALAMSERMGDRPFSAQARLGLAQMLLARGGADGDRQRALDLLAKALESAQEIGMHRLLNEALAARLEAQGLSSLDATTSIDFLIDEVASERPDIASHAAPDGQVTILFSDIEDSTLMTERLGDERWLQVLRAHNGLFRRLVPVHGGYEVKNQGDGFMLVFPDPRRAIECAAAIQRELTDRDPVEGERVRVRMGMHSGEAIREEGDFFGRSVILAARIAAQARGGEILVSEALKERAEPENGDGIRFDDGRELELKGLAGTHVVYRADWQQAVPV